MEFDCNNVDENEKYAFLLGSAIKNEDSDQFFSIYDSIIPKDLPESQIKKIKKRAREIEELPEEEFNILVSKARHYSLASAGISTMSSREPSGQTWSSHCNFPEESEDEGVGSATQSQVRGAKSETSSLYSTTKCSAWSSESETRKCDEDLGLCNSSKATNSVYSLSDGSDSEGKGCFDYYPPQVKIRSGVGINLDYDEAYEVKSEHSSHDDINSPRSDISEGVEMVTFGPGSRHFSLDADDDPVYNRRTSIDQDDFNTDGESDDEQRMRDYYNQGYRPLMKDNNLLSTSKYATKFYSDRGASSLQYPEVDQPIKFSSLTDGTSRYSRYSTLDDHGSYSGWTAGSKEVKVEKNIHKKDRPPFGGKEQFNRVANSIGTLITFVPDHEVKNMPEGRKLEMLQPEDNKKKKKKKKKDDGSTDQNGNPIVNLKDTNAYRQMRESPSISEGPAGTYHQNYGTIQYGSNPHEQSSLHRDTEGISKTEKRRGKKNKNKEIEKQSQDVEHYVGDKPIEDLLCYIDGQNVSLKKSKKRSPSNPEDIPNKTQKQKKSKDKKQRSPTPSIEEVETKGNNSAQSALIDQEVGSNNMGNLSGKTEVNTSIVNGDIDGNYTKKDKISKPLLKDNKELVMSDVDLINHHMPHSSDNKAVYCKESVKDKEIPKTNIKRVAAIETNTSDQKQKKGVDKPDKVSKSEMVLPTSDKLENIAKVDDSAAGTNVTVKQKNSKNKKSKPTSPTSVKVENDVQGPEFFNEQSLFSQILDQGLNEDSRFIFTDIEVPEVPKEDEFQVVGKKKKKPVKEISQPYQQNNYVNHGYKYGKRYDEKSRSNSFMNNKFSSPLSNSSSLQSENDGRARDLSPSAFPALCSGKSRQACSDGRRNSTGDVQIPSDTKSQDDGDKESVKSLPATKASNTIDTVTSPRINMSYAKMAAGVASAVQKTSSIGAEKDSSDPKITVWKGNARERRHSIGSSPDGVGTSANHTPSSSAAMSLKAGSQENLKDIKSDEKIVRGKAVEESISLNKWNVEYSKPSETAEHSIEITPERVIERESVSSLKEAKVGVSTARSVHSQPLVLSKTENTVNSTSVAPSSSADKLKKVSGNISKDMTVKGKSLADSESKLVSTSQTANISALNVHKHESQKSRNNGTNNKKHKSVIFYDKRLEESSSSLDISFGFESDLPDNTVTSTHNPEFYSVVNYSDNSSSVKKDITFDNTDQPARSVVQTVSCASITFDNKSILGQSSNSDVIETSNKDTSSDVDNVGNKQLNTDISEKIDKVSSKLVHLNGIVSQPQGQIAKVAKEMLEDKSLIESDTRNKPATLVPVPANAEASKPHGSNTEVIYYGENVATLKKEIVGPSSTNGPTRYCGVINFLIEVETKSNFYLAEAATYLTKEWNSTIKLQDKDPASVKVHGE